MDVKLDKKSFKALSSSTRVDLLKSLAKRNHMQSELAKVHSLAVPTIKQHLDILSKAGLVEKLDEGRKWKYFKLTKKARAVLEPNRSNIFIVLFLSLIGAFATIVGWFKAPLEANQISELALAAPSIVVKSSAVDSVQASVQANVLPTAKVILYDYSNAWTSALVTSALLFFALFFYVRQKRYQQRLGKRLIKK